MSLERAGIDAYAYGVAVGADALPERIDAIDDAGESSAELVVSGP